MGKYCGMCLNYTGPGNCVWCDGTEENHRYFDPDFVKKDTKPDFVRKDTKPDFVRKDTKPRYINANRLIEFCLNNKSRTVDANDIARFPCTADVVEVVRCRECRFSEEIGPSLYICHNRNVVIVGRYVDPNWYCADGKRGKDNGKIH